MPNNLTITLVVTLGAAILASTANGVLSILASELQACGIAKCSPGAVCELEDVPCGEETCTPIPLCKDRAGGNATCHSTNCPHGMTCISQVVHCSGNQTCIGVPTCVHSKDSNSDPCGQITCEHGTHCESMPVQCGKKPCYNVAICLGPKPPTPNCVGVECPAGQVCVMHEVQCIRAPCPPQPTCIDIPTETNPCASILCKHGFFCQLEIEPGSNTLVGKCVAVPIPPPST